MREKLRNLRTEDPIFWNELNSGNDNEDLPPITVQLPEDLQVPTAEMDCDEIGDDSSVPLSIVMKHALGNDYAGDVEFVEQNGDRGLILNGFAEDDNEELEELLVDDSPIQDTSTPSTSTLPSPPAEMGRGKRVRKPNKLYTSTTFWRHHDKDDSDVE